MPPDLTSEQYTRYSRHLILPQVGIEGQKRLLAASALIVGVGGLGSPAALYLAAAGVGRIGLADFDRVELTNLQRQIIHAQTEIGALKTESGARRLAALNPDARIALHSERLTASNALSILGAYDIVVDGTDNFPTRYLLNDACAMQRKPLAYGSIYRFEGQVSLFWAGRGPCYRCLFPEPPPPDETPSCAEGGVFGMLPGVIGALQAAECVKWILGQGDLLAGRLLLYDALKARFREIAVARDPRCPVCGDSPSIRELLDYEEFCGICEDEQPTGGIPRLEADELKKLLDRRADVCLLDVRQPFEASIASIPGSLNIPLDDLSRRLHELDRERQRRIVVYCRDGRRSQRAAEMLSRAGFADVAVAHGGLIAWSVRVDPRMPRY